MILLQHRPPFLCWHRWCMLNEHGFFVVSFFLFLVFFRASNILKIKITKNRIVLIIRKQFYCDLFRKKIDLSTRITDHRTWKRTEYILFSTKNGNIEVLNIGQRLPKKGKILEYIINSNLRKIDANRFISMSYEQNSEKNVARTFLGHLGGSKLPI